MHTEIYTRYVFMYIYFVRVVYSVRQNSIGQPKLISSFFVYSFLAFFLCSQTVFFLYKSFFFILSLSLSFSLLLHFRALDVLEKCSKYYSIHIRSQCPEVFRSSTKPNSPSSDGNSTSGFRAPSPSSLSKSSIPRPKSLSARISRSSIFSAQPQ